MTRWYKAQSQSQSQSQSESYATSQDGGLKDILCSPGPIADYLLLGWGAISAIAYSGVFCLFLCEGPWKGYRQVNSMFGIVGALGALAFRHLGGCK